MCGGASKVQRLRARVCVCMCVCVCVCVRAFALVSVGQCAHGSEHVSFAFALLGEGSLCKATIHPDSIATIVLTHEFAFALCAHMLYAHGDGGGGDGGGVSLSQEEELVILTVKKTIVAKVCQGY